MVQIPNKNCFGDLKLVLGICLRFVIWDFKPVLDKIGHHGVTVCSYRNRSPTYFDRVTQLVLVVALRSR